VSSPASTKIIVWDALTNVVRMTDAQLDEWKARGVAGFVVESKVLYGMGGPERFTGVPTDSLAGDEFGAERALRDSRVVERAKARGISLYLGFYFVNYFNTQTPLAEWFDDAGWMNTVLPRVHDLAAAAHLLGFAGLAFDEELYPQHNGVQTASWNYDYPGATHSEAAVRAEVRLRGQQLMQDILDAFPDVAIVAYANYFPGTWSATVQRLGNGSNNAYQDSVQVDLWDGLTSVDGYQSILFLDATFYKTPGVPGASWSTALVEEDNGLFALLSQRLSNWAYAADRVANSPFAWIDTGSTKFEQARSPSYVTEQVGTFRSWAMDGVVGLYTYRGLESGFDYSPYLPAFNPANFTKADSQPPDVRISTPGPVTSAGLLSISGTASDDFAIRVVRWQAGDQSGTAQVFYDQGEGSGGHTVRWTAEVPVPAGPTPVTITAEATTGLRTTASVTIGH
jgi:hypothetical protein